MQPFLRVKEARQWVDTHASGWVSVIQSDAVLLMNPWCHGDMRLVGHLQVGWNDSTVGTLLPIVIVGSPTERAWEALRRYGDVQN